MPLYNRQYYVGSRLYHAVACSGWNPRGQVLHMNPSKGAIDALFEVFRRGLRRLVRQGYLVKQGALYRPVARLADEAWVALPLRGPKRASYSFRVKDVIYARATLKRLLRDFEALLDWNDLDLLTDILRRRRVKKPALTAQLIFAAWTYKRTP